MTKTKTLTMSNVDDDFPFPLFVKPSKVNRFDFKKVKEEARLAGTFTTSKTDAQNVEETKFTFSKPGKSTNRDFLSESKTQENLESQRNKFAFNKTKESKNKDLLNATAEEKTEPQRKFAFKAESKLVVKGKTDLQRDFAFKNERNSSDKTEEIKTNGLFCSKVSNDKNSKSSEAKKFNFKKSDSKTIKDFFESKAKKKEELSSQKNTSYSETIQFKKECSQQSSTTSSSSEIVQRKRFNFKKLPSTTTNDDDSPSCSFSTPTKLNQTDDDLNAIADYIKETSTTNKSVYDEEINDIDWDADIFSGEDLLNTTMNPFTQRKDDSAEFQRIYPHTEVMNEMLHQKFGLTAYRPLQEEIINASLTQHDCFVLMPTGGGKSLCYQLPALLTPGVTIVISPLRALISDQVDKLNALDIPAAHLCSDVKKAESEMILAKLNTREPIIKLLYLTPEKIVASKNVCGTLTTLYHRGKLARFVIDEVHCLSQWGHDFRPDYKKLSNLRNLYPDVPIMCLTATATHTVQSDVLNILKLKNVKTFIRGFNRPNIKYQVLPKTSRFMVPEISELIKRKFYRKSGIIYCLCRADCEKLATELCKHGIKAKPYHAGMSDSAREKEQREWMQDQFHVIVATIAFGMGIDKPDVRYVIHISIPKSVEAFYQESGRAGRDGEPSYSYLFYSYGDVGRLQRLMRLDRNVNKRSLEGHFDGLQKMAVFCENKVDCRRYLQLMHLGEKFDRKLCMNDPLTMCDNCENVKNYEMLDVTNRAKELAQMVEDLSLRQNITMIHVADVYKGCKMKKIIDLGHDKHPYYGRGSELRKSDIHRVLKELIFRKVLVDHCQFTGEFPIVYIKPGPKYRTVKDSCEKLVIAVEKTTTPSNNKYTEIVDSPQKKDTQNGNTYRIASLKIKCHEELLEICQKLAQERGGTLSAIMNLSAVKTMAELLPTTEAEFLKIQHVTQANYSKFGAHFLKVTKKYKELVAPLEKPIVVASQSKSMDDCLDDDFRDWCERAGPSTGQKRKSTDGGKRGVKRYKKGYSRKKWKGGGGRKKTPTKKGKWKSKGKANLMPVLHIS